MRLRVENILKERVLASADELVGLETAVDEALGRSDDPYRVADGLFEDIIARESARLVERQGDL
jgi:hypothetical protein